MLQLKMEEMCPEIDINATVQESGDELSLKKQFMIEPPDGGGVIIWIFMSILILIIFMISRHCMLL